MCLYYAVIHLQDLGEFWVQAGPENFLPIHLFFAQTLGPSQCLSLPLLHSISGCDVTSYPFFQGKKGFLSASKKKNMEALESFGQNENFSISNEIVDQVRDLFIVVYTKNTDMIGCSLAEVHAHRFLNNVSSLLKLLPPAEGVFKNHLIRALMAKIIDKTSHIAKPPVLKIEHFGWELLGGVIRPSITSDSLYPMQISETISCKCKKGCTGIRCQCRVKNRPCYIGCGCTGTIDNCSRAVPLDVVEEMDSE